VTCIHVTTRPHDPYHNTINSSACAAPTSTNPLGPATDTFGSPPAGDTDQVPATLFILLVIAAIAFVGALRFAASRSRPRD